MANTLDGLPVELSQLIAGYLRDRDLVNYKLICKWTKSVIDQDECSFWRTRFLQFFDPPSSLPEGDRVTVNAYYRKQYQCRKHALRQGVNFRMGNTQAEQQCLSVVKMLITESFNVGHQVKKQRKTHSNNMDRIKEIVNADGLLDNILRKNWLTKKHRKSTPHPLLLAVQLSLTHISMTAAPKSRLANVWGFPDSQSMVYMPDSRRPIFRGPNCQEVDVEWALHVANFFRHHLMDEYQLIHQDFNILDKTEKPQCWTKALSPSPQHLGKHWKGSYAFVGHPEIARIRSGRHEEEAVQDHLSGENNSESFQSLRLKFPQSSRDHEWPPVFEQILKSRTKIRYRTPTSRAQRRTAGPHVLPTGESVSFRFEGGGEDGEEAFLASGFFNTLPPQQGIPGWHRMTMMKYWKDTDTGEIEMNSLWAYEGVVLPGGMIMLGRWWHPAGDGEYSGPFIFWNVDPSMPENA